MAGLVFDVRGDIAPITKHLSNLALKQIPFATALALTRTAQFVKQKIKEEMPRVFDRPTPWVLNSLYIQRAEKNRLWAMVKIKDEGGKLARPIDYLSPQVYGGPRESKRMEILLRQKGILPAGMYAIPAAGAKLDAYGNMQRGQIQQVLSQVQASFDVLNRESAKLRRRRNRTKNQGRYFAASKANKRTAHLPAGIYERLTYFGRSKVRPVLIFTRSPRYRRRLRFFEIADQTARLRFPIEFARAAKVAIATARP